MIPLQRYCVLLVRGDGQSQTKTLRAEDPEQAVSRMRLVRSLPRLGYSLSFYVDGQLITHEPATGTVSHAV